MNMVLKHFTVQSKYRQVLQLQIINNNVITGIVEPNKIVTMIQ